MKYTKVPEPHRSLLFRVVEIYREHAEPTSGIIPFQEYGPARKLMLYDQVLDRYCSSNLHFLKDLGYLTILRWRIDSVDGIVPKQQALNYYDYSHSRVWRRWLTDFWDLTGPHWLKLLFTLLGTLLGGILGWWLRGLFN